VDVHEHDKIKAMAPDYFDDFKIKALVSGDLVCGDVAIERKSVSDFINSVKDRRVFEQAETMKLNYEHAFVIIIGTLSQYQKQMYRLKKTKGMFRAESYLGAKTAIMVDKGVPVIEVRTNKDYFLQAQSIFKRASGDVSPSKEIKRIKPQHEDVFVSQICCINDVGVAKAYEIAQIFKTPRELCNATVEDIMTVNGVGAKIASRVKQHYF
jgi:Fanconi anemia group M protein